MTKLHIRKKTHTHTHTTRIRSDSDKKKQNKKIHRVKDHNKFTLEKQNTQQKSTARENHNKNSQ